MTENSPITQKILYIKRGDTKSYTLKFRDEDGNAVDITGWTIFFTAKNKIDDVDDDAVIKKTITDHTDPTDGETQITLTSTDTAAVASLVYDIQYKTSGGQIKTVIEGFLEISKDVTIRTTV